MHKTTLKYISIHALCEEGDRFQFFHKIRLGVFLSTPSARRATLPYFIKKVKVFYFYPRPLRGGRPSGRAGHGKSWIFLSTPSARRATTMKTTIDRGGKISIHALCEEGDRLKINPFARKSYFYPRPLRGGRRRSAIKGDASPYFYPRPLRGGRRLSKTQ